jgi:hypothetical protein
VWKLSGSKAVRFRIPSATYWIRIEYPEDDAEAAGTPEDLGDRAEAVGTREGSGDHAKAAGTLEDLGDHAEAVGTREDSGDHAKASGTTQDSGDHAMVAGICLESERITYTEGNVYIHPGVTCVSIAAL